MILSLTGHASCYDDPTPSERNIESKNPYEASGLSTRSDETASATDFRWHLIPMSCILVVSIGFSLFIAPNDPIAEIITLALVFGLSIVSYAAGVAVGRVRKPPLSH